MWAQYMGRSFIFRLRVQSHQFFQKINPFQFRILSTPMIIYISCVLSCLLSAHAKLGCPVSL